MARITVVNDNPEFLALMHEILEDERYETTAIDGDRADAHEAIIASQPELLIIDLRMGTNELHGWIVAQEVRRDDRFKDLPILLCSADVIALREMADELQALHQVRTLQKPFAIDELTALIDAMLGTDTAVA